jgi:predicted transport protein
MTHGRHPEPDSVVKSGFSRVITAINHFGTGNLELTLSSAADIEKARHLIEISYEAN